MKSLKCKLTAVMVAIGGFLASGAKAATVEFQVDWPQWSQENRIEFYNTAVDAVDRDNDGNTTEIINSNLVTTRYGGENAMCVPGFCSNAATANTPFTQTYTFNNVPAGNYSIVMYDSFGDGWDGGGDVTVFINGVNIGSASVPTTGTSTSVATATFAVSDTATGTTTQTCSNTSLTSAWSNLASSPQATSGSIPVAITTSTTSPASWVFSADTMNTINAWSSTAVQGRQSLGTLFEWDPTPGANGFEPVYQAVNTDGAVNDNDPGGLGTLQISFGGRTVNNAIVHLDRVGGVGGGVANSARWSTNTAGVTLGRLAGVGHFRTFTNNTLFRTMLVQSANTESSTNGANGTAAGSVVYRGQYSSLSLGLDGIGLEGAGGDGMEMVVCVPQSDLSLTQTVSNNAPNVGENITFTLTLVNNGPDGANNIQVRDILPAELDFVSSTASQGSYSSASGVWTVGTVANGNSVTLNIVASPNTATVITNQAEIINADRVDPDSEFRSGFATDDLSDGIADDDESSVDVSAGVVDIAVSKTSVNDFVPGGTDTYTIVVSNSGPSEANGVAISDNLPSGVTLSGSWSCVSSGGASCSAASGGAAGGTSVSLTADIPAGGQVTVTMPVNYSDNPSDF
ncbi:DUF11 domain-containing protein [Kangiella marina]|uniref:DUF11 domain-containing protein n=1 Tax=Kangiella marina TaxID=1079178 RepID=A0ABP8IMG7_9GAMM